MHLFGIRYVKAVVYSIEIAGVIFTYSPSHNQTYVKILKFLNFVRW
jgi:hypothetical protein